MKDVLGYIRMIHYLLGTAQSLRNKSSQPKVLSEEDLRNRIKLRFVYNMDEQVAIIHQMGKIDLLKRAMDEFVVEYKLVFEGENDILTQLKRLYNE